MLHDEEYVGEEDLSVDESWAVGLFEGEGCLTLSSGRPRIKLNMTDEDAVRRFASIVEVGNLREDRAQEKHGYKRQWEWYAASKEDVGYFIRRFFHHFGARRQARALDLLAALN